MLQRMREGTKGWVAWLIVIALIASLGLFGVSFYSHGGSNDPANKGVAARVNGEVISQQEVTTLLERFNAQNNLPTNADLEAQRRQSLLQSLIDKNLLMGIAEQNNFQVSRTQLASTVLQIPQFQEQGKFSDARYKEVISQFGYTSASFLGRMQQDLLLNQIQAGLTFTNFILPSEVLNLLQNVKQQRDLSYTLLEFEKQSAPKMDFAKAVPEYYQTHLNEFQHPEKIQLNYIVLSDQESAKVIVPTATQLKQFYEENIAQYTKPAQYQLAHLLISHDLHSIDEQASQIKKVEAGLAAHKSFALLIKDFSDDLLTVNKGGLLPLMPESALPAEFQGPAKALKPGQISNRIQTQQGVEWIQLVAVKPSIVTSFAEVESQLKTQYIEQQRQKVFAEKTQQLQDLVFQNPSSLEAAAKSLGLTIQTSEWLFPKAPSKGLFNSQAVIQAAFSDNVKLGNNSEVLYPDPHTALVLHVKTYQAATPLPLTEVSAKIQTLLIEKARRELTESLANTLTKELNQGGSLEKITKQYGLKWTTLKNVGRHEPASKINSLILSTAFNLPRPAENHKLSAGNVVIDKGIALVTVSAVHDPKNTFSDADKKIYTAQLQSYYSELALSELLNFYRHQAKIEIYQAQVSAD